MKTVFCKKTGDIVGGRRRACQFSGKSRDTPTRRNRRLGDAEAFLRTRNVKAIEALRECIEVKSGVPVGDLLKLHLEPAVDRTALVDGNIGTSIRSPTRKPYYIVKQIIDIENQRQFLCERIFKEFVEVVATVHIGDIVIGDGFIERRPVFFIELLAGIR